MGVVGNHEYYGGQVRDNVGAMKEAGIIILKDEVRQIPDKNIAFIDGSQHFGTFGREMCTVDGLHPNDLGFFRMAEKVYGALIGLGL